MMPIAEYDVVIVGFGAAGASAAITAADQGASVLLLEKADEGHAGGNSVVCKQLIVSTPNKDDARLYMKSMRGNFLTPSNEMIDAYIEEISHNYDWCVSLGTPEPTARPTFMDESTETVYFNLQGPAIDGIYVGPDGTRFCNELCRTKDGNKHGKIWFHGTLVPFPEYAYSVFDDNVFTAGTLISQFTADNMEELSKGWIVKADTLEEFAALIHVDAVGLVQQVADYNMFCEGGKDYNFGRDASTMKPIAKAPFYAIRITPAVINTQGGPLRNLNSQIVDTNGNAIPPLYEAGELGDVWSNNYQAFCNIGGGMAFGRISGRSAAAAKDDNFQGSVMEGKTAYAPASRSADEYACAENEYIGQAYATI